MHILKQNMITERIVYKVIHHLLKTEHWRIEIAVLQVITEEAVLVFAVYPSGESRLMFDFYSILKTNTRYYDHLHLLQQFTL